MDRSWEDSCVRHERNILKKRVHEEEKRGSHCFNCINTEQSRQVSSVLHAETSLSLFVNMDYHLSNIETK